jgi:hypothetical protein
MRSPDIPFKSYRFKKLNKTTSFSLPVITIMYLEAALYKDNNFKNVLDKNDLVIHHLEGFPEIIRLGDMRQAKRPF